MNAKTTFGVGLLLTLVIFSGCGRPQVAPKNLHLTASLRTALSAQNREWLDQNAEVISERHQSGEMSDEEYEAFQAILEEARAGNWREAEEEALALQKAQRPTDEQVEEVSRYWQ
jgi:hypothetical protein